MATAKKKTKKAAPKARKKAASTTRKPRAAPSDKQKAARRNFSAATSLAVDLIYEAGQKGSAKPTWGRAVRAAYGSGSLSGTPARRRK